MKYKLDLSQTMSLTAPPASGSAIATGTTFYAWLPSTWPSAPTSIDAKFINTLKRIFEDSILSEINNVILDADKVAGGLEHRGHVVAIALLCALDAISSYGYGRRNGKQIPNFVVDHFPASFQPYASRLRELYRNTMVHGWNLFEASISPGREPITNNGTLSFGLLTFFDALVYGTQDFLEKLEYRTDLQKNSLKRYLELRGSAKP